MRKAHGQHNLTLCLKLLKDGKFPDWVVTTAFYSAVHFVEHAIFPLIELGIEYVDFETYYQSTPQKVSKHNTKSNLVRKYIPEIASKYRELLDDCNNARYIDYNVSAYNAIESKKKAEAIKSACLKKKP